MKLSMCSVSPGDFSALDEPEYMVDALSKTYKAITNTNNWGTLKNYVVDSKTGFIFAKEPFLTSILNETERLDTGHSGSSWGVCMRAMHHIATHGWEHFCLVHNLN